MDADAQNATMRLAKRVGAGYVSLSGQMDLFRVIREMRLRLDRLTDGLVQYVPIDKPVYNVPIFEPIDVVDDMQSNGKQFNKFAYNKQSAVASNISKSQATSKQISVIAVHTAHDASIAVSINGRVQCALELERLFGERHYSNTAEDERGLNEWDKALKVIRDRCECDAGPCPSSFDVGVGVHGDQDISYISATVEKVFSVKRWIVVDHHWAHASIGFHASPFRSALVVSFDGGSPNGCFFVYHAIDHRMVPIANNGLCMGHAYLTLSGFLPEVTGVPISDVDLCKYRYIQEEMPYAFDGYSTVTDGNFHFISNYINLQIYRLRFCRRP